jgi:Zn-finger protein
MIRTSATVESDCRGTEAAISDLEGVTLLSCSNLLRVHTHSSVPEVVSDIVVELLSAAALFVW